MAEADARSMLTIARRDLKAAWILQDASIAEVSWGFQVQQVVEKALKAWLFQLGDSPPFTHDLVVLFKRLLRVGADVEAHRDLARFTEFCGSVLLRRRTRTDGPRSCRVAATCRAARRACGVLDWWRQLTA